MTATARITLRSLADAAAEARAAWSLQATLVLASAALATLLPAVASPSTVESAARGLLLAFAGIGLVFALGLAGLPSLGQGAFLAVGAFTAALLRVHLDVPLAPAASAGMVAGAAAGIVVGLGVVRLPPVFVAVTTWLATWLVALALTAFPDVSGGAQGLALESGLGPGFHYEVALGLVGASALGFWSLRRGVFGLRLGAASDREPAALALGVDIARLRLWAFTASAAIGGLAGALLVDLDGVADASEFDADLSFQLLVAALIGGAASALGAPVGVAVLAALAAGAHGVASSFDVETSRFDPMLSAAFLLTVLGFGGQSLVPAGLRRLRRVPALARAPETVAEAERVDVMPLVTGRRLVARDLSVRFGSIAALKSLSVDLGPGQVTALIGPNGSGKSTALRVFSGRLRPDSGTISVDGDDVTGLDETGRVRLGIVRTLQARGIFAGLTALENALVGAAHRSPDAGPVRTLLATPRARAAHRRARDRALAALARVGLAHAADLPAGELTGTEQRLLAIATAWATGPSVLLVDEPSAGAGAAEIERIAAVVDALRASGVAVVLVEHNLRLVRRVADRVVVLVAGEAIAAGTPDEIAADTAVRDAYLGGRAF
jgi:ABC-type branched-subunit amino acid transport system ATPase component/ABC-type branched-subunit amino acid transport system permease subunit